ncbi:MAG: phosphoadenylyl-sulfate reductase [Pseudomonadota bacterium]
MSLLAPNTQFRWPEASPGAGARADRLNRRFANRSAVEVVRFSLTELGRVAMVSSFGADSVVLLHMVSLIDRAAPVWFIDTEMLFPETLTYQQDVAAQLGLSGVMILRAGDITQHDPRRDLHKSDTNACCALRKTRPLKTALGAFDGWITGRKRFQSGTRASLSVFEPEAGTQRLKINPLAHWRTQDVQTYIAQNDLPRHPLVAQGYPSIGCAPCTSPVNPGEDPRAGRWRNSEKEECGIHFVDGKLVRNAPE